MTARGDRIRSRLGRGTATDGTGKATIRERFARTETAAYWLSSTGAVVHEDDGEQRYEPTDDGSTVAGITDRHLYFAIETEEEVDVIEIPFRDVRDVEASAGILGSKLAVRVWNRGTYRIRPGRGDDVEEAGEFLERVSDCWQRVLAALDTAREEITELGRHVERGDEAAANEARAVIQTELDKASYRIVDGGNGARVALTEERDAVETELHRTEMRSRVARGSALADEGERLTRAEDWDEAAAAYRRARECFDEALAIAEDQGFRLVESIRAERADLAERVAVLEVLPLRLAEHAWATATASEESAESVGAWADALESLRTALTVGWGQPTDFDGNTRILRWEVERAANNLIDARLERAREIAASDPEAARAELEAAADVARELAAGDLEEIRAERERLLPSE